MGRSSGKKLLAWTARLLVAATAIASLIVGSIALDEVRKKDCTCDQAINSTSLVISSLGFDNAYTQNATSISGLNSTTSNISVRYVMTTPLVQGYYMSVPNYTLPDNITVSFEREGSIVVVRVYEYHSVANATFGAYFYSALNVPDVFVPMSLGVQGNPVSSPYGTFVYENSADTNNGNMRWRIRYDRKIEFDGFVNTNEPTPDGPIAWMDFSIAYSVYSNEEYVA